MTDHETNPANSSHTQKRNYTRPVLMQLGSIGTITLGNNGSTTDGDCTLTQNAGGNKVGHCDQDNSIIVYDEFIVARKR